MPSSLSRLYVGPLEALTPPSVAPAAITGLLAGRDLRDPACLARLLDRFAAGYDRPDRRALASLWSKWHFSALLAPGLAANLLLERDLPLALYDVDIILADEGHTERLHLAHTGNPLTSLDAFTRFSTLIDDHLMPLIAALATVSGTSPRVFWSNAGNYFEYFADSFERHPLAIPGGSREARRLLESRRYPDGRHNPLYRPVNYIDEGEALCRRVRRLCCLRYLVPELGLCGNCPLNSRSDSSSGGPRC